MDGKTCWQGIPTQRPEQICLDLADTAADHRLEIVLSGKTRRHTQLDTQGNIINDAVIRCQDFAMDDISIDNIVWNLAQYTHDFNGTRDQTTDRFYGVMGCNGRAVLYFSTPIYLWLLESM